MFSFRRIESLAAFALTLGALSSAALADTWSTGTSGRISSGSGTKIGIGTTSIPSDVRMQVNGNVRASGYVQADGGVRVKTWAMEVPDYVFDEKKHKPMDLMEVERFVKEHKHLPEIPSAKEMKAEGMDLVEMNLLLLKKVEELTLYVIDQEKKIKDLTETKDR